MKAIVSNDMIEATRLTRQGRLIEASALLQRALTGAGPKESAAPAQSPARWSASSNQPRIVDIDPDTGKPVAEVGTFAKPAHRGMAAGDSSIAAGPGHIAMPAAMPAALRGFIGKIIEGGSTQTASLRTAEAPPDGAQFVQRSFDSAIGNRSYKLYIPSTYRSEPAPLIVMLHGCTQSPDDFASGTRMNMLAEEFGCLVAYPGQTQAANAQKCWNWFNPADQTRDQGEPALIAGITRQIMQNHAVDPKRVYVAGLSAGGAAAAIMAQAYPDLYAAAGVHSGLACGAARDMPSAFAAMRQGAATSQRSGRGPAMDGSRRIVPTIVFHSDNDHTVHPRNGDQVIAQSAGAGGLRTEVQQGQVQGGHAYSLTIHADAAGQPVLEQWLVHGGGHAWSGGSPAGSFTDPRGPDASREMLRFFLEHPRSA